MTSSCSLWVDKELPLLKLVREVGQNLACKLCQMFLAKGTSTTQALVGVTPNLHEDNSNKVQQMLMKMNFGIRPQLMLLEVALFLTTLEVV